MNRNLALIACLFLTVALFAQNKFTISGYVTDNLGEELIGANVIDTKQKRGTITNAYGFYSLTLAKGHYKIEYSFIGYQTQIIDVDLNSNQ
jgi:hypothetical protein